MHISLDSALGRQRRLNSVGESVFQIAPNAAAGYSLRSLTGGDPAVVRVRRESDNAERDFNASGVSSGELVNWVNQQITPPLDLRELTATGRDGPIIDAAAAYSLRNLSDSYTGNVVDVRRSSDDATRSFTAAEVADGTLTDWVNTDVNLYTSDFSVSTNGWNGSGATLTFGESIGGESDALKLEGTTGTIGQMINGALRSEGQSVTIDFDIFFPSSNTGDGGVRIIDNTATIYEDFQSQPTDTWISLSSSFTKSDSTTRTIFRGLDGSSPSLPLGDIFYIKNIVFTQTTADGFVSQWYDQSTTAGTPNANHAVQTDAAKQPKIVDAGSLVTGGLDFDGVGDKLDLSGSGLDIFKDVGYGQVFTVITPERTSPGSLRYFEAVSGATGARFLLGDSQDYASSSRIGGRRLDSDSFQDIESSTSHGNNETLITGFLNWTDSDAYLYFNGTQVVSSTSFQTDGNTSNTSSASAAIGGNTLQGNFKMQELIIYNTDQTDNRTALEANIGEVYSIAGIPAYDDTVNGFVETWYDQSGNDNDAVQLTANNQPKIVDGGSLLNELLFEGSQLFDSIPLSSSAQPNSIFTVSNTNVASQTRGIYGTSASQAGYYRSSNRHFIFSTGTESSALEGSAYVTDRDYLRFDLFNGANSVVGVDGDTTSGTVGDGVLDRLDIGDSSLSGVDPLNGGIKELILYLSDQSANRAAIEANINNQYDIY